VWPAVWISLARNSERNVTKFAPHEALKSITRGKLTLDERVVLRRVAGAGRLWAARIRMSSVASSLDLLAEACLAVPRSGEVSLSLSLSLSHSLTHSLSLSLTLALPLSLSPPPSLACARSLSLSPYFPLSLSLSRSLFLSRSLALPLSLALSLFLECGWVDWWMGGWVRRRVWSCWLGRALPGCVWTEVTRVSLHPLSLSHTHTKTHTLSLSPFLGLSLSISLSISLARSLSLPSPLFDLSLRSARCLAQLQGYLAHKKLHPPRTLQ